MISNEIVNERLDHCRKCDKQKMMEVSMLSRDIKIPVCGECKCPLVHKAQLPVPTCPLKKWMR